MLLFVLLAIPAGCIGRRPAPIPSVASPNRIAPAVREGYVDALDGVRLFYRMVGTGPETVVVIHGGPGFSLEYIADDLQPLAERYTLLFYDQRGTGRSSLVNDAAALDAQRFAEDLEALRRHFGLGPLTLLGHSWGAGVAALYAVRYPERVGRLVIVGGIPLRRSELLRTFQNLDANRDSTMRQQLHERREAWHADPGDAAACRAYYVLWFFPFYGDRAAAARSKGDFCAGSPAALRNKVVSVDRFTVASLGEWDWRPALRAVTAPALVIHGTLDVIPVAAAREWAAAMPNARLLLLEGIGHFPYLEAPEQFAAALDDFFAGTPAGGRLTVTRN